MYNLIYEDKAPFGAWLLFFLFPFLIICLVWMYFMHLSWEETLIALIVIPICTIFYWAIQPRRYQIFGDRLKITRGIAASKDFAFYKIRGIKKSGLATGNFPYILWVSYVTSFKNIVEIAVSGRLWSKVYISPSNRELFLDHLNKALDEWRRSNPS